MFYAITDIDFQIGNGIFPNKFEQKTKQDEFVVQTQILKKKIRWSGLLFWDS